MGSTGFRAVLGCGLCARFGVQGLGFRVQGSGFRALFEVQGGGQGAVGRLWR